MPRIDHNQLQSTLNINDTSNEEKFATRSSKASSFVNDVLPMALSLGLKLGTSEGLISSRGRRHSASGSEIAKGVGISTKVSNSSIASGAGIASSASGLASLAGAMNIAGGIIGAAEIATSWGRSTPAAGAASGTAVGAAIGTMFAPGIGTAIGAAIGALGGGLLGSIKTGKHRDQKVRDQVRSFLKEAQILDNTHSIGLADGSRFNIGYDGGPKKELGGRRPFETDMTNPLTKQAVSWLNPVVAFISQGNQKVQSDFVGYFANAALSNAKSLDDVRDNVNTIIKQFGLDDDTIVQGIVDAAKSGALNAEIAKAWLNGVRERKDSEFKGENSIRSERKDPTRADEIDPSELQDPDLLVGDNSEASFEDELNLSEPIEAEEEDYITV